MIPARIYEHPIESLLAVALLLALLFASTDRVPEPIQPAKIQTASKI